MKKKTILYLVSLFFLSVPLTGRGQDKKAWEIGAGGSLINWSRVSVTGFQSTPDNYMYNLKANHLMGGANLYVARELNRWFYLDLQGTVGVEKNKNRIVPVLCYEDILKNEACGKLSALLTVEEGAVCGGSLERLRELYDMGVRMLTLTWNYRNELGWPATRRCLGQSRGNVDGRLTEKSVQEKIPGTGRSSCAGENPTTAIETEKGETGIRGSDGRDAACGLTETGRDFVTEMERLGMIPDVSHLSDAGFDDVWECTKKPFVASHSNARAVCPSLRNLTDDRVRRLAERGGCMGLNYYDKFLVDGGSKDPEVLWEALIRQARHITDVGGTEILGLGSDFDGIPTNPALPGAEAMPVLWDRLKTAGFTENQLDGIFWGNVMRVYRDAL